MLTDQKTVKSRQSLWKKILRNRFFINTEISSNLCPWLAHGWSPAVWRYGWTSWIVDHQLWLPFVELMRLFFMFLKCNWLKTACTQKARFTFLWCCIWINLMKSYNRKWWTELQFEFSKWLADLVYLVKWKPQNRRIRFRGKFRENWKYCMASFQFVSLFSGFRITLICKFPGNVPDRWVMIGVTARKFLGISSSYENESSINE